MTDRNLKYALDLQEASKILKIQVVTSIHTQSKPLGMYGRIVKPLPNCRLFLLAEMRCIRFCV